jgi:Domain of unknown function (DUF4932)
MLLSLLVASALTAAAPAHVKRVDYDSIPRRAPRLTVEVNPGMELIAIMAWLAQRYPTPPDSPYKTDAWAHFRRFRTHPALAAFKAGRMFPDFTETGLWFTGGSARTLTLPDSSSWYTSFGRDRVAALLQGAIAFARDSHFDEFHRAHQVAYSVWSRSVQTGLERDSTLITVERFFHATQSPENGATVRLYLEPLNGWGAHFIIPAGRADISADGIVRFQFGPESNQRLPDSPVTFTVDDNATGTVWHEAGHGFVAPMMRAHATRIAALNRLFDSTNTSLVRQGITSWPYALEENLVRSVVAVLIGSRRGPSVMRDEVREQADKGFVWVPRLADLLQTEYLTHRDRYPTLESFAERMFTMLEQFHSVAEAPMPNRTAP